MEDDERYKKIKVLGRGGFGTVWLAEDLRTGQQVALKVMHVPVEDPGNLKALERFLREIQIALILEHPHVLRAMGSGYMLSEGYKVPYLVSPYIPEGSLHRLIRETPPWQCWTLAQTADVILQAAQGLHYLHTREPAISHQDVKPANFLLSRGTAPERPVHLYLCDFGISRWQRTPFDRTNQVLGTIGYIAPEQYEGAISWTADQYALAVMAYYFLTGVMPQREAFVLPSQANSPRKLPEMADRVLLKALQTVPARRYPSILAFAEELQAALLTSPPQGMRNEQTQIGMDLSIHTLSPPPSLSDEHLPSVNIHFSVEGKLVQSEESDSTVAALASSPASEEHSLLQATLKQFMRKELPTPPRTLNWSGDGEYLVCTFYTQMPVLVSRQDGSVKSVALAEPARSACWSPDNRVIAFSSQSSLRGKIQSRVQLWRLDDPAGEPLTLLTRKHRVESLDWSSQGQLAVWIEDRVEIYTLPQHLSAAWRVPIPQTLSRPDMSCGSADALRWSPDGSMLAMGTRDGTIYCWRANTARCLWQKVLPEQLIFSVVWSPDGTSLSVASSNMQVVTYAAATGNPLYAWKDLPFVPRSLSISAEHSLVLASDGSDLLLGSLSAPSPQAIHPGYWFAVWSPTRPELATLDVLNDKLLLIWEQ